LNVSEIGLLVGIMSFAEFALFFPAGIAMDRWGRKTTAVPSLILLSAGLALLPFTKSLAGMAAVVLLTGIANGIGSGINITLSTDFAPEKNPSEFIGVWRFVVDVGTAGGPFLVGALATVLSLGVSTVIIAAVGLSGAAIMGLFVPEPLKR
jgi:MFS family permease